MRITLVLALAPRQVQEWTSEVPENTSVRQALEELPWREQVSDALAQSLELSVWGRPAQADTRLHEGDRIELTRPLRVDPKVARRERFQRQGVRTAGLFARRQRP